MLSLLVRLAQRAGLSLQLRGGALIVQGRASAVAAWAPELRRFKARITKYLKEASNNGTEHGPEVDEDLYVEMFEERAGVLEFEAGMSRRVAEVRSALEVYSLVECNAEGVDHA